MKRKRAMRGLGWVGSSLLTRPASGLDAGSSLWTRPARGQMHGYVGVRHRPYPVCTEAVMRAARVCSMDRATETSPLSWSEEAASTHLRAPPRPAPPRPLRLSRAAFCRKFCAGSGLLQPA